MTCIYIHWCVSSQGKAVRKQESLLHISSAKSLSGKANFIFSPKSLHKEMKLCLLRPYQNFVVILPRFIYELPEIFKHFFLG